MKKLNKAVAAAIIFILILGNTAVFTLGDSSVGTVQEFAESFDTNSGIYTETFANGRQFTSTVPDGGKTYDAVILYIPKDISVTMTCDGTARTVSSGEPIYGKGYYVLNAVSTDVITGEVISGCFTFRIMGEPVTGVYNEAYGCQMISCVNSVESDYTTGLYKYSFPNCKAFFSSVSSYGESVEQASFVLPKNLGYSLKMNGSQISYNNNEILKTSGSYTMTVYAKNYGITNEYARVYKTDFNFIIENTPTVSDVIDAVKTGVSDAGSGSSDAAEAVVETTTENIVDDSLSETYNSDANLYKETFSNGEGFYANIANGDLSGGNVYIDIPSNMTVTMTKDGIEDQFVNKKYINTEGTYILNITSSSDGVKYKAKFSFRVQKGIEASADAVIDDGIGDESEDDDTAAVFDEDYVYEALTSSSIINEFDNENNLYVFTVGTEKFYANMPAGMFANSSLSLTMPAGLDYSVNKDGEEYENDNDNPDLYEESGSYTFFVSDKYGNSLEADFYLYSNPVNSFESYNAPGGYSITDLTYSDYRDNYGFDPDSDTVKFLEDTSEDEPEVDQDNGGTGESADTDETAADAEDGGDTESEDEDEDVKAGAEIINTQIKKASKKGLDTLVMPLDGRYTIELRGDGLPALQTEIVVDTIAPVVDFQGLKANMKSTGNEVYLSCDDDETTLHLYSKSGTDKILGDAGGSATITGVGEYTLIAVDKAGNQSEYTFKITRHIGAAGVGAIVLVLLIIIGVCVYMFYNSKKFSVR